MVLDILASDFIRAEPTGGSEARPDTCWPKALLFNSPSADCQANRCCHGRGVCVEWVSNGCVVAEVAHAASPAAAAGLTHTHRNWVCVLAGYCCTDALSLISINSVECGGASCSALPGNASTSLICGAEMKRSGWKRTAWLKTLVLHNMQLCNKDCD